jgi:ABC-type multidrug transport system permease subunit
VHLYHVQHNVLTLVQFMRLDLDCNSPYLIPYGPSYNNVPIANKVCTLPGSVTGQSYVSGKAYIKQGFQLE